MMKGKGKLALLVLNKLKGKDNDDGPQSNDEVAPVTSLEQIGRRLIDALQANSAKGVGDALQAAHQACMSKMEDEGEYEDEDA